LVLVLGVVVLWAVVFFVGGAVVAVPWAVVDVDVCGEESHVTGMIVLERRDVWRDLFKGRSSRLLERCR
jgi:hypothetical protein